MHSPTERWVHHYWGAGPSTRTFLYYAYLLTIEQGKNKSIKDSLLSLVSVQQDSPASIIRAFVNCGIYTDDNSCCLTELAFATVGTLLQSSCGVDGKDIPLNGLKISQSSDKDRETIWVNAGISKFKQMFGDGGKKVSMTVHKERGGSILLVERDVVEPFISVYFMHIARMVNRQQSQPLLDFTSRHSDDREKIMLKRTDITANDISNGTKSIKILAAPTYQTGIATSLYEDERHRRIYTIGPINLSFINYHMINQTQRHANCESIFDFYATILHPNNNYMVSGIIFSDRIIELLKDYFQY